MVPVPVAAVVGVRFASAAPTRRRRGQPAAMRPAPGTFDGTITPPPRFCVAAPAPGYLPALRTASRPLAMSFEHLRPRLLHGLDQLGLAADLAGPLLAYLGLLDRWNRTYNLTAIRDPDEMLVKHLFDSLAVVPFVGAATRLGDIGAGAGLPSIPVALARPDVQVCPIESAGKKARFMREAARRLGLGNVRVFEARAEAVPEPGAFDCLISRAFGTLAEFVRVGAHLLAPGGRLLAMKGQVPQDELDALGPDWTATVHPLRVPELHAERHLVVLTRAAR